MYKKILLAYDGSDAGQKALLDCRDLANWSHADLHLIAVMPSAMSFVGLEGGVYDVELEERERRKYRGVLDDGLVARVDVKADRAAGVLRVPGAFAEPTADIGRVAAELAEELATMASWLGLDGVAVGRRGDLAAPLRVACR